MGVDVQERNAARQQAALVLPYVKNLIANGQPVPDFLMEMLETASPGAVDQLQSGETPTGLSTGVADTAPIVAEDTASLGATAPVSAPAPVPVPDAGENITKPLLPGGVQPTPVSAEAERLLSQLPEQQQPSYFYKQAERMAKAGASPEEVMAVVKMGNDLLASYNDKGIPLPSGKVLFPGVPEAAQKLKLNELKTQGAYEATSQQTERSQKTVENYQTNKNTLDQAATMLAKTGTGQFEETKSYLVTALNSLGLISDAGLLEQATGAQELRKIFSQILFNGGLKDKIGSQIAARELDMFSKGFGDINLEPSVNRFIVGTMRGILDMEAKRAEDWIGFVNSNEDTMLSRKQIADWEIKWNKENPISKFVGQSIANTPAKGEITPDTPLEKLTVGYKYVMPDGTVKVYTGNEEDNFFVDAE
jgi:hypothetical protein